MTGIFKANNPSGNAILFFYAVVLKLPLFLHVYPPQLQASDGILYKALLHIVAPATKTFPFALSLLTFFLLFIQAISFNRVVNTLRMHRQPNFLTGMCYLLFTSLFPDWFSFSAPLVVNTFMIFIWSRLCSLYNNPSPQSTIFNIGLATGLAAFFYFPSVIFLVLIVSGIAVARPFRLKEWLTGLAGIITPIYFYGSWLFLTGKTHSFQYPGIHFSYPHFYGNPVDYVALFITAAVFIAGAYFVNANINRQVVQTRKSWQLLFIYVITAAVVPFVNAGGGFSYWILLAVPISPVLAAAFLYPRKRTVPLLLHWLVFALCIIGAYFMK